MAFKRARGRLVWDSSDESRLVDAYHRSVSSRRRRRPPVHGLDPYRAGNIAIAPLRCFDVERQADRRFPIFFDFLRAPAFVITELCFKNYGTLFQIDLFGLHWWRNLKTQRDLPLGLLRPHTSLVARAMVTTTTVMTSTTTTTTTTNANANAMLPIVKGLAGSFGGVIEVRSRRTRRGMGRIDLIDGEELDE